MTRLILYLLESSVLLTLFYLVYVLVLRKETFFSLNRFFLLGVPVISLVLPLLSFNVNPAGEAVVGRSVEEISKVRMSYYEALAAWEFAAHNAAFAERQSGNGALTDSGPDYANVLLITCAIIYVMGIVLCLSRTIWTLRWIQNMISSYPGVNMDGVKVVKLPYSIAPFSFLSHVFAHQELVDGPDFIQILEHEKIHVRQRHSVDLIFVQLLAAIFWFNPVVWRLIKSLKTTHEYIADRKVITMGHSLVAYQTLLLSQLISNNSYGLVHNFNLSFIKKRILMMKNKRSGWSGRVKVAVAIVCTLLFGAVIIQCNSRVEEQDPAGPPSTSDVEFADGVQLPVLPNTAYTFDGDLSNALSLVITRDKIKINGEETNPEEIGQKISQSGLPERGIVVMHIDRNQSMALVRDVMFEFRKAGRRMLLYTGQTTAGGKVELPFLLPPLPGSPDNNLPEIDDQYLTENNMDMLEVDLGNDDGYENQKRVYDFVIGQLEKGRQYVVSAKYEDDDSYGDYLSTLTYVTEGFNQIYQERAQRLFGKDFYDLEKEQYNAVRKGIPRAISIAD